MSNDLKDLIGRLGQLSTDDLQAVQLATSHLLSGTRRIEKASSDREAVEEEFYLLITRTLKNHGMACPPWLSFRRTRGYKSLHKTLPDILIYTTKHFGSLKRRDRVRLYRLYAEMLLRWMRNHPAAPMRVGVFFQNLSQIPALVSEAFPGYANEGWLQLVLRMGSYDRGEVTDEDEL